MTSAVQAYHGAAIHVLTGPTRHGYKTRCGKERRRWSLVADQVTCASCQAAKVSLTKMQERIVAFIAEQVTSRGYPPTVREIGTAVGLSSTSSVHRQLGELVRKGAVEADPTKPRALRVVSGS